MRDELRLVGLEPVLLVLNHGICTLVAKVIGAPTVVSSAKVSL
jgi:hypothetical protein